MVCVRKKRRSQCGSTASHVGVVSVRQTCRIAVFAFVFIASACGQNLFDQPHIASIPQHQLLKAPTLRADANLVLIPVTVLDSKDRVVTGLQAKDFSISENHLSQTIKCFSQEDAPVSITVVLDASGSMAPKISAERAAALELLNEANQGDEFSLIAFGTEPRIALRFSEPADDFSEVVNSIQPDGFTSLWDGVHLAIQQQKNARYARRAIVVISDGGDNHSRYTEDEIKSLLREADVQVYAIALSDRFVKTPEEKIGPLRLDEIASVTGGRAIRVHDATDVARAAREISSELRSSYVIGYYPATHSADGKWRVVKVQLTDFSGKVSVRVNARSGYYGPTG